MSVITLSLLKYLEDNGLGTIDKDLFWQKLGIGEDGLYITDLGSDNPRGQLPSVMYEIYSRHKDDLRAYVKLQKVTELLRSSYNICALPALPEYELGAVRGVTIMPPSAVSSMGEDANGHIIYSITGRIYYTGKGDIPPIPPQVLRALATGGIKILVTEN